MEGAIAVLAQFLESNLEHVSNKSAYLCGVMKTYRQKSRAAGHAQVRLYRVTNLLVDLGCSAVSPCPRGYQPINQSNEVACC